MMRNIQRKFVSGIFELSNKDLEKMIEKGWTLEVIGWPHKLTNNTKYTIDFEIYELAGETDYKTYRTKN